MVTTLNKMEYQKVKITSYTPIKVGEVIFHLWHKDKVGEEINVIPDSLGDYYTTSEGQLILKSDCI